MSGALALLVAVALPLALALASVRPRGRPGVSRLAPLAALPALAIALLGPGGWRLEIPWLLQHAVLELDETGRIFLGLAGVLYLAAAWQARSHLRGDAGSARFFAFLLAAMAGNFGLVLAADVATFYLGFALMSLASVGLVLHTGDAAAARAGRIQLAMAMLGEALLFTGLTTLAARAGSTAIADLGPEAHDILTELLLVAGFGIKAGALSLHFWLPLAHPAAPAPASAVLSGTMIKAGLLGWLRFLPLGAVGQEGWGVAFVVLGLAGALGGVLGGALRSDAKAVLAWSSIAQMGVMMTGVGAGLMQPEAWPAMLPALLVYTLHHGLAKGAAFLGVAPARAARSRVAVFWTRWGLLLPALALAGAPFTSGAFAKVLLKSHLGVLASPWSDALAIALPLAATGTTLLMFRFLALVWPRASGHSQATAPDAGVGPWVFALAALLVGVWLLPTAVDALVLKLTPSMLWKSTWPVLLGIVLAVFLHRRGPEESARREPLGTAVAIDWLLTEVARLSSTGPARSQRKPHAVPDDAAIVPSEVRPEGAAGSVLGRLAPAAEARLGEGVWPGGLLALVVAALALALGAAG